MINETTYPIYKETLFSVLSPSIHWAQQHNRVTHHPWARRIYDFEFLYILEGEVEVQIGGQNYLASSGYLIYLAAGVHHRLDIISEPCAKLLGIHFDYFDELESAIPEDLLVEESQVWIDRFCAEPSFTGIGNMIKTPVLKPALQVRALMEDIIYEYGTRKKGSELICKGLLLQVFAHLLRLADEDNKISNPRYSEQIIEISKQIELHYADDWSKAKLAKLLHVHQDYMAKIFKDVIGVSPNKYVQHVRFQEAKRLLRETDSKIEEISKQVGYEDYHYFSRVFQKLEGMPPKIYRKKSSQML